MTTLVLLDRDGVINHDSDAYIKSPDEWCAIDGSLEAMAHLHQNGYKVAIATNQSGIGRGLFSLATLHAIHTKMLKQLEALGGHIDALAYCPHHPDDECQCRKPLTGLVEQVYMQLNQTDFSHTYLVGDTAKDIALAHAVGVQPILVATGKGVRTKATQPNLVCAHAPNLQEAADYIHAHS